jgi:flagellin-specific chaperone FliS
MNSTSLTSIILQGIHETYTLKERRIGTTRISTIIEKLSPTLTAPQKKEITELLAKLFEGVAKANETPYSYYNTLDEFQKVFTDEIEAVARKLVEVLNQLLKKPTKTLDTAGVQMAINTLTELYLICK